MMRITNDELDDLTDFVFMMKEDESMLKCILMHLDDLITELSGLLEDLQSVTPVEPDEEVRDFKNSILRALSQFKPEDVISVGCLRRIMMD